jgi:two-component system CitB family sensor kinase
VIICVVLIGVAAVTVAQSTSGAQEFQGRRAQAIAETLANARVLRDAVDDDAVAYIRIAAETTRTNSGSASVVVARADRSVIASADPDELRRRYDIGDSTVLEGRGWVGERQFNGSPAAVAMAPVLTGPRREIAGFVVVTRLYPSVMDGLAAAAPNLLTYLGLASAIGIVGSLLVARRVKRQTLGMEPTQIAGLVEHRDAMLHGIREGVVGLDLRGQVTLINDEAIRLLHIPGDALGRTLEELGVGEEMRDALLSGEVERDRAVASAGRVLVVNRLPIASRGKPFG